MDYYVVASREPRCLALDLTMPAAGFQGLRSNPDLKISTDQPVSAAARPYTTPSASPAGMSPLPRKPIRNDWTT